MICLWNELSGGDFLWRVAAGGSSHPHGKRVNLSGTIATKYTKKASRRLLKSS